MMDLTGKKVVVIGLSKRTGVATARMLAEQKARVVVSDIKRREDLKEELAMLKDYDIDYELGGHSDSLLRGDLIIVSPGVPLDLPFFKKARKKGIKLISEIELAYHFTEAKIVAITGTNGKTTTTALTGEIFKKAKTDCRVRVAGNIGVPLIQEAPGLTADDWLIVEVSSFQLEACENFRPFISAYLNFSPDHLDRHKTIKKYWQAKKQIFAAQKKNDFAVINQDDPQVKKAARDCQARIHKISLLDEVKQGTFLQDNMLVSRCCGKEDTIIARREIPLPGDHNIANCAFAIQIARLAGISKDVIKQTICDFQPHKHRMEKFYSRQQGTIFIDDSKATNPLATISALKSLEKPVILIAGGQDRQADFSALAAVIKKHVKTLILLGESKDKIEKAVLKQGFNNIYKVEKMVEAVEKVFKEMTDGDCVLLSPACPSWDMYQDYKERGNHFKNEVNKYLS